jgi:type IV pilus assembly protein PilA
MRRGGGSHGFPSSAERDLHTDDHDDYTLGGALHMLRSRLSTNRQHDEGFTLIELMVVVMIIAVLLAIAIPTFLGSQNKAKDRSAQSSLRNTLTAAKTIYTDGQDYTAAGPGLAAAAAPAGNLVRAEPSLAFVVPGTASTDPKTVSVATTASTFYGAAMSSSGTCYYIKDDIAAGTTYGQTSTAADCTGTKALTAAYTAAW